MEYPEVNAINPIENNEYDPYPIAFDNSHKNCPKCRGKFLFNFSSGEIKPAFCKAYSCEVCGDWKKFQLEKAIVNFTKDWDRIRLWTFTFSSHIFKGMNLEERLRHASKIWKTFRDLIRRDILLSRNEKSFSYIKFVELQENGSPHFHALIDRFIFQPKLNKIWQKAIKYNTAYKGTLGNANVNGGIPKKQAGRYVIKYITKQITEIDSNILFRRWSKSGTGTMFAKKEKSGEWIFIALNSDRHSITSAIEFAIWKRNEPKEEINQLFNLPEHPPRTVIDSFDYGTD